MNLELKEKLAKEGFRPKTHTVGLWKHDTTPISFVLVVDEFRVKYDNTQDTQELDKWTRRA